MTLRQLCWAAQGARAAKVTAALLPYYDPVPSSEDLQRYIETGVLTLTGCEPLPYSPAVMEALARQCDQNG